MEAQYKEESGYIKKALEDAKHRICQYEKEIREPIERSKILKHRVEDWASYKAEKEELKKTLEVRCKVRTLKKDRILQRSGY